MADPCRCEELKRERDEARAHSAAQSDAIGELVMQCDELVREIGRLRAELAQAKRRALPCTWTAAEAKR